MGESTIISEGEIEDASYLNAIAKKYKVEYSYENEYTGDNITNNFIALRNAFKKKYGANSYYDAFINTVWGRTLSETARLKGRWLGEKFGEQAFKGSLKYTKAIGRALSKKVGGNITVMGMYGYNVASDAATFEGYPDLQEQAKKLEDRSFAIGVAAPAIGAGVGSAIPVIGTGFGAGAGEFGSFFMM